MARVKKCNFCFVEFAPVGNEGHCSDKCRKESRRRSRREYVAANKEKVRKQIQTWREGNRTGDRKYSAKWKKENPQKHVALEEKRRALKLHAVPAWANLNAIAIYYEIARLYTELYGEQYHIDHIIPLQGKNVCGLHVENNLQIITAKENMRKHNKVLDAS